MEPYLFDGDWLLVEPLRTQPHPGRVIVARDPRQADRLIVKRIVTVEADGSVYVAGDHPAHRAESAVIGRVAPDMLVGRPWLRYWPPSRVAPL